MGNNVPSSSGRRSDTVIVKNLPPNTTWIHLKDKFREVGDVAMAEMQNISTGLVKFNSDWEAERAVHHDLEQVWNAFSSPFNIKEESDRTTISLHIIKQENLEDSMKNEPWDSPITDCET